MQSINHAGDETLYKSLDITFSHVELPPLLESNGKSRDDELGLDYHEFLTPQQNQTIGGW